MKKDKLIKLYKLFNEYGISPSKYGDSIKKLTDYDVELILESKHPTDVLNILLNDSLDDLDLEEKIMVIRTIDKIDDDHIREDAEKIVSSENVKRSGKTIPLFMAIASSRHAGSAGRGYMVATDDKVLLRNDCIKIVELIVNANIVCAGYASEAARNEFTLASPDYFEFIKMICNANNDNVKSIYEVCTSKNTLDNNIALELAKYISTCAGEQVFYLGLLGTNISVIKSNKIMDILKIVANSKSEKHAAYIYELIKNNKKLIYNENILEVINILSQTENDVEKIYMIIPNLIYRHNGINLIKLISKCKYWYQSEDAIRYISSKKYNTKYIDDHILYCICNATGSDQAHIAYNLATNDCICKSDKATKLIYYASHANGKKQVNSAYLYLQQNTGYLTRVDCIDDYIVEIFKYICNLDELRWNYYKYANIYGFRLNKRQQLRLLKAITSANTEEELSKILYILNIEFEKMKEEKASSSVVLCNNVDYSEAYEKSYNFWKLYNSHPRAAIELLSENGPIDVEITDEVTINPIKDNVRKRVRKPKLK